MKHCACGRTYEPRDPARRVGVLSLGGEVLLLANCDCGSTGAIVLIPHPIDVKESLGIDDEDDGDPIAAE